MFNFWVTSAHTRGQQWTGTNSGSSTPFIFLKEEWDSLSNHADMRLCQVRRLQTQSGPKGQPSPHTRPETRHGYPKLSAHSKETSPGDEHSLALLCFFLWAVVLFIHLDCSDMSFPFSGISSIEMSTKLNWRGVHCGSLWWAISYRNYFHSIKLHNQPVPQCRHSKCLKL